MILIRITWVTHKIEANISKSVTFASISFINIFWGVSIGYTFDN